MHCPRCQVWTLHAAWAITYGAMLLVICATVTLVCSLSFLRASSPSLLFVLLLFFAASELAFGMMVAALFNNAKIAGIVAPLAHFACLLPRYIFFRTGEPQASNPPHASHDFLMQPGWHAGPAAHPLYFARVVVLPSALLSCRVRCVL